MLDGEAWNEFSAPEVVDHPEVFCADKGGILMLQVTDTVCRDATKPAFMHILHPKRIRIFDPWTISSDTRLKLSKRPERSSLSTKDLLRDGSFAPDVAGVYEMLSVSEVANNGECRRRERQHVRLVVDDCTCSGAGKCVHKPPEPTRNTVLHFSNNGYTYRGVDPNIPKPRSLKPGVEPLEQRRRRGFMQMGLLLGGILIASLGIVPLYRFCCGRSKRKLHTSRLKSRVRTVAE